MTVNFNIQTIQSLLHLLPLSKSFRLDSRVLDGSRTSRDFRLQILNPLFLSSDAVEVLLCTQCHSLGIL